MPLISPLMPVPHSFIISISINYKKKQLKPLSDTVMLVKFIGCLHVYLIITRHSMMLGTRFFTQKCQHVSLLGPGPMYVLVASWI